MVRAGRELETAISDALQNAACIRVVSISTSDRLPPNRRGEVYIKIEGKINVDMLRAEGYNKKPSHYGKTILPQDIPNKITKKKMAQGQYSGRLANLDLSDD